MDYIPGTTEFRTRQIEIENNRLKSLLKNEPTTSVQLSRERKTEIRQLFKKIDSNENGFIEKKEFFDYMQSNNIAIGIKRTNKLFEIINFTSKPLDSIVLKVGYTYQDLVKYFENETARNANEPSLKLNLDAIVDLDKYIAAANLVGANLCQDSLTEIARGLQNDDAGEAIQRLLREDAALCNSMKNLLANSSQNNQESLEKHKIRIWKPFDGFTRRINQRTVMSAPSGIVQDLLPGQYKPSELIDYPDLPALEPQKTVVEGVQWIEGQEGVKDGQKCWIRPSRLVFPATFNGHIETDVRIKL